MFEEEQARLADVILGFTARARPVPRPPGTAERRISPRSGGAFAGTINSPQGPQVNVSMAILTAGDERMTVLVSLVTTSRLRAPAFSVVDSILNTFRWNDPES